MSYCSWAKGLYRHGLVGLRRTLSLSITLANAAEDRLGVTCKLRIRSKERSNTNTRKKSPGSQEDYGYPFTALAH